MSLETDTLAVKAGVPAVWVRGSGGFHGLVSGVADGPAGVGHVVHQDGHAVFHVAHQHHAVHLVGLLPLFVDEGKVHVQAVGDGRHAAQRTRRKVSPARVLFKIKAHAPLSSHRQGSGKPHRLAPPASGETMMQFFHSGMFSLIHLRTAGSA